MSFVWPHDRAAEALMALVRVSKLSTESPDIPNPPRDVATDDEAFAEWIKTAGRSVRADVEQVDTSYSELESFLRKGGPALVRLQDDHDEPGFIAILSCHGDRVSVLASDLSVVRLHVGELRQRIAAVIEAQHESRVDELLSRAGVPQNRRTRAKRAILGERLAAARMGGFWLIRASTDSGFWHQMRREGVLRHFAVFVTAHAAEYGLLLCAWWTIGRGALEDRLDTGWLIAWLLLLLSMVPFRMLSTWASGLLSIDGGSLIKRRLLSGVLKLRPDEIRHQGAGQMLGKVLESSAIEQLALMGGLATLTAVVEALLGIFVLSTGAGGLLHAVLFTAWLVVAAFLSFRYYKRLLRWTTTRLDITHDLVERMVGHRTRLVQEPRSTWHSEEDQAVARYLEHSAHLDRGQIALMGIMPRGWLILGVLGLTPSFVVGETSLARLAIGLGGILFGSRVIGHLVAGVSQLASALVAYRQVSHLFEAAGRKQKTPPLHLTSSLPSKAPAPSDVRRRIVESHDLSFSYRAQGRPVLDGVDLSIHHGDRVLVEGPSGGGKSTLASMLTGLREPDSGLLLLDGLDRHTLGLDGWRQRVVSAPQFHENYVFSNTLAFNLLMGRGWPPTPEDLELAEQICLELGLGNLLERMPAGMQQTVGETGWQLSHGEQSRLFIARALLQGAELVILDESFAALDPENLRLAHRCALAHAPALMVIAHP